MYGAGIEAIRAERHRVMNLEGHAPEHDDEHYLGQLAEAALAYLWAGLDGEVAATLWPFEPSSFKPGDRVTDLVKAGQFIAAEIDRLLRQEQAGKAGVA